MLIQGIFDNYILDFIVKYYFNLVNRGINNSDILVLFLNSYKKAEFLKQFNILYPEIDLNNNKIYTLSGLCYNAFIDNWKFISKFVANCGVNNSPNLCGLEVSQYIFKECIKSNNFSDYISKINLLHQLFRRYSLIVQNCLTNEEVLNRSKYLGESFAIEAQKAIDDYKLKTFEYNSFDYLRQLAVFPLIYNNTDYFKNIKYLILCDADEYSYAYWKFIEKITPQLNDFIMTFDDKGASRCGYLCAYKAGVSDFIKKFSFKLTKIEQKSVFFNLADNFYTQIKKGEKIKISEFSYFSFVKRIDMIIDVIKRIQTLIKLGVNEEQITIITPIIDEILFQCFYDENIKFQILSGNEKLSDDFHIKSILIILKLINNIKITENELKIILIKLLKIPFNKCLNIIKLYEKENAFINFDFELEKYNYTYSKFISIINAGKKDINNITEQIKIININLLQEFKIEYSKVKYNFLLKEAKSFEIAFNGKNINLIKEFIVQIENSIISENPANSIEIKQGKIIISTPQKIIDYSYKTKYQIWLDISSSDWIKNDTGTLYNAWGLSRDWNKNSFTIEDNIMLTNDKTARIVRKLMHSVEKNIIFYSSLYDNMGNENFGGITEFIEIEQQKQPVYKIIPRSDQKPVLDYQNGKLGIMAVPGAGKTTILLALIIKLLNLGVNSKNIFVLTYMESAAKNFKEKIKLMMPQNSELPNISTIHGLALRIIKENGNYNIIGLDENFEICDDNIKENIIRGLFNKLKFDEEKYDNYIKCISQVKLSCFKSELVSKYKEIQEFYNFYNEYNKYLKEHNLVDYEDMLYFAVKILEENNEIKKYYQNICQYIIEDEAQDSTDIQQRLIGILSGKYNNLVRCGDINQAITSTFTSSNPEGFKNFIKNNRKVEMISSQRCAKPIYTLANEFIKETDRETDAFYKIEIKGTEKNPNTDEKPIYLFFENETDEKMFILNKIKKIKTENKNTSIAILLRLNSQVNEYNDFFTSNDIKTSILSDCLNQKSIYKIIFLFLKIIQNPLNNNNVIEFAKICRQKRIYHLKQTDIEYIKLLKNPFIMQNPDEIDNEALMQLYFDIDYHINNTNKFDILALNIGLYYSKNEIDKSNAYMISTLIKKLMQNSTDEKDLLLKLDYASQKNTSAYKFFDENEDIENVVKIMTMHKSKGDEFDYVFIPELNEENYGVTIESVKLKSGSHFIQTIKNQTENTAIKSQVELKQEQVNETMRLLYVGITRAKQAIYFTNAKNYKRKKNTKTVKLIEMLCKNNKKN